MHAILGSRKNVKKNRVRWTRSLYSDEWQNMLSSLNEKVEQNLVLGVNFWEEM